jgi:hypothetical protein
VRSNPDCRSKSWILPVTGKHSGHGDYDVLRRRYRGRICPASPLLQAPIPPSVRIGVAQRHRDHPGFLPECL